MGKLMTWRLDERNNRIKTAFLVILSFVLPLLITVLALVGLRIDPFGSHSLAITDAQWYINGQADFARMIREHESVLYSLRSGLGINRWAGLSWGSFAPASLLSVFAALEQLPSVFTWICAVNISLCGLTMYLMLNELTGEKASNLIFSTSYALMGFNVANAYQTLFFIGPQMLPLMILGLIRLFRGKSPLLYIGSLAFCIFSNFYFGFMLCVASLVVFFAYMIVNGKELSDRRRIIVTYIVSSLTAGLLAAFFWLPALKAFTGGGRMNQTKAFEYSFDQNMSFLSMFSKLFSGANSTDELVNGLPNIFCGILTVALVILYFMNNRVEKKRKTAAGILLTFYLITFYITAFTLAMHGGTHTNWFNYRYSYVFSFLLLCIAAEQYRFLPEMTISETKRCGAVLIIGTLIVLFPQYEFLTAGAVLLDLTLLFLMWIAFYLFKTKPEKTPERLFAVFLILVTSINLYSNFIISTHKVQKWEKDLQAYYSGLLKYGSLIDGINEKEDGFFRMEKDFSESGTIGADPALYNYNGVSSSGPTIRAFVHEQLCRLGINWYDMRHWYSEGIPAATDALLGLKYVLSEKDLAEEKGYENKITFDGVTIYESPYYLLPAIVSDDAIENIELGSDIFENLNNIWKGMSGENRDVFTEEKDISFTLHNAISAEPVTYKELTEIVASESAQESSASASNSGSSVTEAAQDYTYIEYEFTAAKDGPIYLFNTSVPETSGGSATPGIIYVGCFKKGDTVNEKLEFSGDYMTESTFRTMCSYICVAYADNGVLTELAETVRNRDVTFNTKKDDHLFGTFTADQNQRLLFTIPWDEGWTCYIDGEKVNIDKTWDLFMSVEVPAGEHTYEMKFFPAWMNYGIYISSAAAVGLVMLMIIWTVTRKKAPVPAGDAVEENAEEEIEAAETTDMEEATSDETESGSAHDDSETSSAPDESEKSEEDIS